MSGEMFSRENHGPLRKYMVRSISYLIDRAFRPPNLASTTKPSILSMEKRFRRRAVSLCTMFHTPHRGQSQGKFNRW